MDNKDDIFKEAQQASIEKLLKREEEIENNEAREKVALAVKERLEEGESQWDFLKRALEGSLTEKFLNIMQNMNDREFVRTYLKLLEYTKPKLTRTEGGNGENTDVTVNIQTLIVNSKGEKEYVPINAISNGVEK